MKSYPSLTRIGECREEFRWRGQIGDSHLFTPFPCLGSLFLGPTDWQGTQSATQRVFEPAEE